MFRSALRLFIVGIICLSPTLSFAHAGIADVHGFTHGFGHPIGGLDHVLAMVAVGVFAANLGGRALWAIPATFVALMAAGGTLGMMDVDVPFVEIGIALSVLVLGAVVAFGWSNWPLGAAMALVGSFAIFHGHAHGAEMPENALGVTYAAGFMLATALLHALGVGAGVTIRKYSGNATHVSQALGCLVTLAGTGLLISAF